MDIRKRTEAMKCRFRSRMICANVIEHLHDRYVNNISLHYDGFYSDYSLHLKMKLDTLHGLIVEPFVFEIHQHVDLVSYTLSLSRTLYTLLRIYTDYGNDEKRRRRKNRELYYNG